MGDRARIAVIVAGTLASLVIAGVALITQGWALGFGAFAVAEGIILGWGFWPEITDWWKSRGASREAEREPGKLAQNDTPEVESSYEEVEPKEYRFPDTLGHHVFKRREEGPRVWGVDLKFTNPGRTDTFDAKYVSVQGANSPGPAPGSYLDWRGRPKQDARKVASGDTATLFLCKWRWKTKMGGEPGSIGLVMWTPSVVSTTSTGTTTHSLGGPGREPEPKEITYVVRFLSHATDRQARYEIRVGASGAGNPPEVSVQRLGSTDG